MDGEKVLKCYSLIDKVGPLYYFSSVSDTCYNLSGRSNCRAGRRMVPGEEEDRTERRRRAGRRWRCERTEHGSYAQVSLEGAPCVLDKERRPLG